MCHLVYAPTFCNLWFFINCEADSANNSAPSTEDQVRLTTLQCYLKVLHSHLVTGSLAYTKKFKNRGAVLVELQQRLAHGKRAEY